MKKFALILLLMISLNCQLLLLNIGRDSRFKTPEESKAERECKEQGRIYYSLLFILCENRRKQEESGEPEDSTDNCNMELFQATVTPYMACSGF